MKPRTHNRFVPRLESLADRLCPAVTFITAGHTVTVLGDADNNTIQVTEESSTFMGFSVTADGQGFNIFSNTTHLVVKGGLGDDRVTYDDAGLPGRLTLEFDLGPGTNSADLHLDAVAVTDYRVFIQGGSGTDTVVAHVGTVAGSRLDIHARLGAGDDSFDGFIEDNLTDGPLPGATPRESWDVRGGPGADSLNLSSPPVSLPPDGRLTVRLRGEAGDDTVAADLDVTVVPAVGPATKVFVTAVRVTLDGGDGDDTLIADLTVADAREKPPAKYVPLLAAVRGAAGDDTLSVVLNGGRAATGDKVTAEGGAGFDTADASPGVLVLGSED